MPKQAAPHNSPTTPETPTRGNFAIARFGFGAVCGLLLALLISPLRSAWRRFYKWVAM